MKTPKSVTSIPTLVVVLAGSLIFAGCGDTAKPTDSGGQSLFAAKPAAGPTCVSPPSGLVAWWPGDGNASDIVGGNNGTLMNGAAFAPGKVGQAFSFDGLDDFVSVPDNSTLDFTTAITFDAWVNPDRVTGELNLVDKTESGDNANYRFLLNLNGRLVYFGGSPFQAFVSNTPILPGQFSHVAVTLGGGVIKFYVNGNLTSHFRAFGPPTPTLSQANNGPLKIGRDIIGRHFDGLIDEVELFNRVLSASEIKSIFDAGSAGKCKDPQTKDDCKNGGWEAFGFKNQGQCVRFIETGKDSR